MRGSSPKPLCAPPSPAFPATVFVPTSGTKVTISLPPTSSHQQVLRSPYLSLQPGQKTTSFLGTRVGHKSDRRFPAQNHLRLPVLLSAVRRPPTAHWALCTQSLPAPLASPPASPAPWTPGLSPPQGLCTPYTRSQGVPLAAPHPGVHSQGPHVRRLRRKLPRAVPRTWQVLGKDLPNEQSPAQPEGLASCGPARP